MESVGVKLVQIGLVALLAFVVEVLVEHLVGKPLETAAPYFPRWWLIYVSLVAGGMLGWFSQVNAFEDLTAHAVRADRDGPIGRWGLADRTHRGEEGAGSVGGCV
jgi:hypothetical protein